MAASIDVAGVSTMLAPKTWKAQNNTHARNSTKGCTTLLPKVAAKSDGTVRFLPHLCRPEGGKLLGSVFRQDVRCRCRGHRARHNDTGCRWRRRRNTQANHRGSDAQHLGQIGLDRVEL